MFIFFSQDFLKVCLLLQAYDVNFFLNIGLNHPKVNKRYLKCIPQSDCRLKSLKINSFDFRGNDKLLLTWKKGWKCHFVVFSFSDSLNYISASLDSAVADHKLRNQEFKITKQSDLVKNSRGEFCEKRFSLVEEAKGVFCYSYLSSWGEQIIFFFFFYFALSDLWQFF